jgi:hypothetical protein
MAASAWHQRMAAASAKISAGKAENGAPRSAEIAQTRIKNSENMAALASGGVKIKRRRSALYEKRKPRSASAARSNVKANDERRKCESNRA